MNVEMLKLDDNKIIVNIDEYHLVYGNDARMYDTKNFHVACYSDLEDGYDGDFHWYTESGIRLTEVTHISKEPLSITNI